MKKEEKELKKKEKFPREKGEFGVAHRRWLVREIVSGRISVNQAIEKFDFQSKDPQSLLYTWCKRYSPEIIVSLPLMTEKERQKQEELQKRIKELEKQLEFAQMKNIALETLIDVAEEQLSVPIRKKAGAKQ
jgi:RNase H-fold protein (predicted Holliday junction resolvase)